MYFSGLSSPLYISNTSENRSGLQSTFMARGLLPSMPIVNMFIIPQKDSSGFHGIQENQNFILNNRLYKWWMSRMLLSRVGKKKDTSDNKNLMDGLFCSKRFLVNGHCPAMIPEVF